jgi:DNA-binding transcriptional LysR family regulator
VDIEELRTFVAISDAGGIAPAAFRLGVTKSIVSRRLLRLEKDLGVQLLFRSTRGAALTEAGALFRHHAVRACAEIDVGREATQPAEQLRGCLRVTAPATLGPTHFAPALADLARLHPQLLIHASYSDHVADLIAEGFDCAIRLGALHDSNLLTRKIGSVPAVIVASPAYIAAHGAPGTVDELMTHEALLRGTECWQLTDGTRKMPVRPQGRFKADNGMALVGAALVGLGVACFPVSLIHEHLEAGALVPVLTDYPVLPFGVHILRPPSQHPCRKIRALTDLLAQRFSSTPQPTTRGRHAGELQLTV